MFDDGYIAICPAHLALAESINKRGLRIPVLDTLHL